METQDANDKQQAGTMAKKTRETLAAADIELPRDANEAEAKESEIEQPHTRREQSRQRESRSHVNGQRLTSAKTRSETRKGRASIHTSLSAAKSTTRCTRKPQTVCHRTA